MKKGVRAILKNQAVRFLMVLVGAFTYGMLLANTGSVVEVEAKTAERINLEFENAEVRSVLQAIAQLAGVNIVVSKGVQGKLSMRLQNVAWSEALAAILQSQDLVQASLGGVVSIRTRAEAHNDEKTNANNLEARSFRLNYAKASDVEHQIKSLGGEAKETTKFLGEGGTAFAEPRTNQLFVVASAKRLTQVAQMISKIDIPLQQVLIEARVVLVDTSFGRNLGARFGGYYVRNNQSEVFGIGPSSIQVNQLVGGIGENGARAVEGNFVNLPATPIGGVDTASAALALFNPVLGLLLNLEISALEAQGKGRVLSHPRVVTTDKNKAVIEQGTELPYQVVGSDGAVSLQFRKAILKLEVLPRITPTGDVLLDLSVSKDRVGRPTAFGFAIDTRHVQTQVLVENGGTVAIGGIYEEEALQEQTQVPLLGDIPGLGLFFRGTRKREDKSELLVLVTPRIITAQENRVSEEFEGELR